MPVSPRLLSLLLGSLLFTLPGCILPEEVDPSFNVNLKTASRFIHRGMVQNDKEVAQGSLSVDLPTANEGTLRFRTFANMDLRNSTGDAWFPDGAAGKFSEIDYMVAYGKAYELGGRQVDVVTGLVSYVPPDGTLFPNGARATTTELFAAASTAVGGAASWAFRPRFELHIDWDEADGYYALLGGSKTVGLWDDRYTVAFDAHIGFNDGDHADWTYGIDESGLADFETSATVSYKYDERTWIQAGLGFSTILDSDLEDWFELIGIDDDNFWVEAGVDWRF